MNDINVIKSQDASLQASKAVPIYEPKIDPQTRVTEKEASKLQPAVKERAEVNPNSEVLDNSEGLLEELNSNLELLQSYLKFEKDEDTDRMVFFIKDSETNEVIRQVPAKELLQISKQISDYLETVKSVNEEVSIPAGLITNQVV